MKNFKEGLMKLIFLLAASVSIAALIIICVFLFSNGIPAIFKIGASDFLLGLDWRPANDLYGIFPMIIGSIIVSFSSLIIGVPIGILCAVFMVHFCPKKLYQFIKPGVNLMVGIPSVVYGFFGLVVIVPFVRAYVGGRGFSILSAVLLLSLMILPTIINVSESAIKAVPSIYYEGGLALGATHERSVFFASLPAAKSGIFAAIILGVGRAVGETMAIMMIAGNQPVLPNSPLDGIRTLTTNIVLEMGYATDLHREALIASAVVLFIFILIINFSFTLMKRGRK